MTATFAKIYKINGKFVTSTSHYSESYAGDKIETKEITTFEDMENFLLLFSDYNDWISSIRKYKDIFTRKYEIFFQNVFYSNIFTEKEFEKKQTKYTVSIEYAETEPTLKNLFSDYPIDFAVKYCKERGYVQDLFNMVKE